MTVTRPRRRGPDYAQAFLESPVGLAIGRDRIIIDCNRAFATMFRGTRRVLTGSSFAALYPDELHFVDTGKRVGRTLRASGSFANDRVMRRLDGELFWVHVRGRSLTPAAPHRDTLWVFTELSGALHSRNTPPMALTPRERDIAALFVDGRTAKEAAATLGISPRTVDIYRTRLLRKYGVRSTPDLVQRLLLG